MNLFIACRDSSRSGRFLPDVRRAPTHRAEALLRRLQIALGVGEVAVLDAQRDLPECHHIAQGIIPVRALSSRIRAVLRPR